MTTLCYTIINNLMAGLALHDIEARIPCFYHLSDASFENTEETIDVVIQCRDEDVGFVKEMLARNVEKKRLTNSIPYAIIKIQKRKGNENYVLC